MPNIIERVLAGERNAFEELIREYQRLVNHIVYRMIPNRDDREDICQDIFIRVYQNLKDFRADSKLSTWIARIAGNRCLDYLGRKNLPVIEDDFDSAARAVSDDGISPEEATETGNLSEILEKEINSLPTAYRTVITLYHIDDMSYAEIGDILALPDGTVKSYLFRARKMLRQRLEAGYRREELWQ